MKITIDKQLTTLADLPKVKEATKDFKHSFTDDDLRLAFISQTGLDGASCHVVLSADVEAFPCGDEVRYLVKLCTHGWRTFCELEFFCSQYLEINVEDSAARPGDKMYQQRIFKEA